MKQYFYIFFISYFYFGGNFNIQAQTTDCSLFCVTNIQLDTTNANTLLVTIGTMDSSSNHINYPYLRAVIDSNGDTVASNTNLQFFAHIGGMTMDYPIPTTLVSIPTNFTCTVILNYNDLFGNGDTSCVLPYPCVINNSPKLASELVSLNLFPNPAKKQTTLVVNSQNLDYYNLIIYNAQGQVVLQKNNINESSIELDFQTFTRGLYIVQLSSQQHKHLATKTLLVD